LVKSETNAFPCVTMSTASKAPEGIVFSVLLLSLRQI